jgi:hypothetical protein
VIINALGESYASGKLACLGETLKYLVDPNDENIVPHAVMKLVKDIDVAARGDWAELEEDAAYTDCASALVYCNEY